MCVVSYSVPSARFSATRLATYMPVIHVGQLGRNVTRKYSLQAPGTSLDEYQERVAFMSPRADGTYAALSCQVRDGETSYTFWTLTLSRYNYDITLMRLSRAARLRVNFLHVTLTPALYREIFLLIRMRVARARDTRKLHKRYTRIDTVSLKLRNNRFQFFHVKIKLKKLEAWFCRTCHRDMFFVLLSAQRLN